MNWNAYLTFFFGTPRRLIWTLVAVFIVFWLVFPDPANWMLLSLLNKFVGAINPLLQPVAAIGVVLLGFWILLRPLRSKPKKGNH